MASEIQPEHAVYASTPIGILKPQSPLRRQNDLATLFTEEEFHPYPTLLKVNETPQNEC
jgi:hypothetical protein